MHFRYGYDIFFKRVGGFETYNFFYISLEKKNKNNSRYKGQRAYAQNAKSTGSQRSEKTLKKRNKKLYLSYRKCKANKGHQESSEMHDARKIVAKILIEG